LGQLNGGTLARRMLIAIAIAIAGPLLAACADGPE
jgi:hypothetical protein